MQTASPKSREQKSSHFLQAAGKTPFDGVTLDTSMLTSFLEEVQEFSEAYYDYLLENTEETRENLCKEWADVQVTLSNMAWYLNIPAEACLNRVVENNNTKIIDGQVLFREDGKVLKPEGYVKVSMKGL